MLAMLRSNPAATNAVIGPTMATILSVKVLGSETQPDGETHENIGQGAEHRCLDEPETRLGLRDIERPTTHDSCSASVLTGPEHQESREDRPKKVCEVDQYPVPSQRGERNPAAGKCHGDEVVTGEQFGATNDDENEAQREHESTEQARDAEGRITRPSPPSGTRRR